MVASLIVFLPGTTLTTAVLELAAGQMVSGASRLVSGVVQPALLSFGILAGIDAVGIPSSQVLFGREGLLGSGPPGSACSCSLSVSSSPIQPRQVLPGLSSCSTPRGPAKSSPTPLFGGYVSALIGATVMTVVAVAVSRLPTAAPPMLRFSPGSGCWSRGALGLIGLTELAGGGGGHDLVATIGSIFGVALGVLCGTQLSPGSP